MIAKYVPLWSCKSPWQTNICMCMAKMTITHSISAYVSCHGSFPLCQFPLCQFPFDQCWHGGNWQSGKVHHFITSNHCYRSVNFLVYIKPNVRRWQNCMMPLGVSIVSNTRRDWLQGRMDLKSPWGGLPSSGHWAKLSNRLVPFATVGN